MDHPPIVLPFQYFSWTHHDDLWSCSTQDCIGEFLSTLMNYLDIQCASYRALTMRTIFLCHVCPRQFYVPCCSLKVWLQEMRKYY
jgi:hypothetical protein